MELCGSEVESQVSLIPLCAPALMPHALHIQMTARQRRRLRQLRRDPRLRPRERDRVEMCLLSAQGWTAPRLAVHLDVCAATVRRWIRQWEARPPAPWVVPAVDCAQRAALPPRRHSPAGVSRPAPLSAAPAGVEFPHAVCGLGYPGSASAAAHGAQIPAADGGQLPTHQVLSATQTGPGTGGSGPRRVGRT